MVIYELRQSAYDKAFDLIEEAKKSNKKTKLALCELYDCLIDCSESESDEYEDEDYSGGNYAEIGEVEIGEINYRDDEESHSMHHKYHPEMRRGVRRGMRRNMRDDMYDRSKDAMHHSDTNYRRNRLGRYTY